MKPLLFELSAAPNLAETLAGSLSAQLGRLDPRRFPDEDSYVRFQTHVKGRDVILLCTLDRPDAKLAPLLFAAAAARSQGASNVGLAASYLAYMRQDKQFHPGEAVTSETFARLLSDHFDWLVTVDPHLHRHGSLDEIYSARAIAATATDAIGDWIRDRVDDPVIIGPDEESRQWVERIAKGAAARSIVLHKERSGDYSVTINHEALKHLPGGTPVLVDDIASSARTLIEAVHLTKQHGLAPPVCAVVHAIFAGDSYERLLGSGVARVVSTNTVAHETNAIDVSQQLADAIARISTARSDRAIPAGAPGQ